MVEKVSDVNVNTALNSDSVADDSVILEWVDKKKKQNQQGEQPSSAAVTVQVQVLNSALTGGGWQQKENKTPKISAGFEPALQFSRSDDTLRRKVMLAASLRIDGPLTIGDKPDAAVASTKESYSSPRAALAPVKWAETPVISQPTLAPVKRAETPVISQPMLAPVKRAEMPVISQPTLAPVKRAETPVISQPTLAPVKRAETPVISQPMLAPVKRAETPVISQPTLAPVKRAEMPVISQPTLAPVKRAETPVISQPMLAPVKRAETPVISQPTTPLSLPNNEGTSRHPGSNSQHKDEGNEERPVFALGRSLDFRANVQSEQRVQSKNVPATLQQLKGQVNTATVALPAKEAQALEVDYSFQRWTGDHSVKVTIPAQALREGKMTLLPSDARAADALSRNLGTLAGHSAELLQPRQDRDEQQKREQHSLQDEEQE